MDNIVSAIEKYERRVQTVDSLLCVGLDSDFDLLPEQFQKDDLPQFAFNRWMIEQTHPYVSAYKPNMAFYEARGQRGWAELALTMAYLREHHPDIFTICDAKRADIGSTNKGYVRAIFDELGFDAITLHPYLGREALGPFLEREDKVSIILCSTSNPGAGELQDLEMGGKPLWQVVAERVRDDWNTRGNCMLVAGATTPDKLAATRKMVGEMTLLVPGIGAQGGSIETVIPNGINRSGRGLIVNAGRSVIFAENPAQEAKQLRDAMNGLREKIAR